MSPWEAFLLGLLQGITEFLPVSSSGHIELGKALLGINLKDDILFTLIVHLATVLSIMLVFYKDILSLLKNLFSFKWNEGNQYVAKLVLSAVPAAIIGLSFKSELEKILEGRVAFVGCMLIVTGIILWLTTKAPKTQKDISFKSVVLIGLSQAIALLPGISRSGSTIATALYLGIDKEKAARFSFLMILLPIIGASFLEFLDFDTTTLSANTPMTSLLVGFIAAFISGYVSCRWMYDLVKKGKIAWFAIYCFIMGTIAIVLGSL